MKRLAAATLSFLVVFCLVKPLRGQEDITPEKVHSLKTGAVTWFDVPTEKGSPK
jgi:hypothetical protein